jgi:uncharacterized membrane protein
MGRAGRVVMAVLAIGIAGYAALVLFIPGFGAPFVAARRVTMPLVLSSHLAGGLTALALGPWQLNGRFRRRHLRLHRWMGRTYVTAVLLGGLGALGLARVSEEGFVTHVGFGLLAVLWLIATLMAYLRIRARDQVAHRQWMIRSYALTLAAVTLRVYLPLSLAIGMSFTDAYQAVSWFCWVPNLVVAEWMILQGRAGSGATSAM